MAVCVSREERERCFLRRSVHLGFPASLARDLGVIRSAVTSGVTWTSVNLTLRDPPPALRSFTCPPISYFAKRKQYQLTPNDVSSFYLSVATATIVPLMNNLPISKNPKER